MLSSQQSPKSPYPEDLARWLELDYHQRLRPLRRARKWVTLGTLAVTALALGWTFLPGKRTAYEAAPVSTAHALFRNDCNQCHTESWQPAQRLVRGDTVRSVTNAACLECHDAGPHHVPEALASGCATCHHEHRGKDSLAKVTDGFCTACHADLRRVLPTSNVAAVTAFAGNHPEFAPLKQPDKGTERIRFDHAKHLRLDLNALRARRGPESLEELGERLECSACHQPDSVRRYMRPIRYEQHCVRCHPLWVPLAGRFDDAQARAAAEAFAKKPALHKEPELVRADLRERYLRFVKENPVVLSPASAGGPRRPVPGADTRTATESQWLWAKGQVKDAEERLFAERQLPASERLLNDAGAGCGHCHKEVTDPARRPGGLPAYQKPNIPERWLGHSVFSHDSHRMLGCLECHGGAATEGPTRLLLPSIASCKSCHATAAGARGDCALCHDFHDHGKERNLNGKLKIADFVH